MEGANTELAKSKLKAVFWEAPGDTHSCLYYTAIFLHYSKESCCSNSMCVSVMCSWHFDHRSQALFISVVLKRLLIGPDPT